MTTKEIAKRTDDAELPALIASAGSSGRYAWEEFLYGEITNSHTRRAYAKAVGDLLNEAEEKGLTILQITPRFIRGYLDRMDVSIPTKKLRLAAIRRFFDIAVTRHVIPLNPSLSVRGERYKVVEGKTPEITVSQVRKLLKACDEKTIVGLRDKVIISTLIYTAARVGAVVSLNVGDFSTTGDQWTLKFKEKGNKAREIPVRHDLELLLKNYIERARLSPKDTPLFRSAKGKTGELTSEPMQADDVRRMIKRRLRAAGLSTIFSPHSFRVCTLTDLLKQDIPREDVQYLAGHADPRTTSLYDRRGKKVSRNIVERISI